MKSKRLERKAPVFRYSDMFWLFIFGSLLGVLIEGVYCLIKYGNWETHVVSMFGPFCIIYGFGSVGFYIGGTYLQNASWEIRFLMFAFVGTVVEFICGWVLEHGLKMYAWDYSRLLFNYHGYVCPSMAIVWGAVVIGFGKCIPYIDLIFDKMHSGIWNHTVTILSVFMVINLGFTAVCIIRWAARHEGISARNSIEEAIDRWYDDEYMSNRFCEWHFLDERKLYQRSYCPGQIV